MEEQTNWQQFAGDLLEDRVPPPWPLGPDLDEYPIFKEWLSKILERLRKLEQTEKDC